MTTQGKSKTDMVTRAQQLSEGVSKHLASMTQVVFTGGPYTPAQITTNLRSLVKLRADVNAAKATATAKVAAERARGDAAVQPERPRGSEEARSEPATRAGAGARGAQSDGGQRREE